MQIIASIYLGQRCSDVQGDATLRVSLHAPLKYSALRTNSVSFDSWMDAGHPKTVDDLYAAELNYGASTSAARDILDDIRLLAQVRV